MLCIKKKCAVLGSFASTVPDKPHYTSYFFFKNKEIQKLTRKLKRQLKNAMLDRIENLADKNPKDWGRFWKLVNSIKLHQSSAKTNEIQASEWFN